MTSPQRPPHCLAATGPLPSAAELRPLLRAHGRVLITSPAADEAYEQRLFEALAEYVVGRPGASMGLLVQPGVSTRRILALEPVLLAAARQFRQQATALVHRLAARLGLDPLTLTLADLNPIKLAQVRAGRRVQPLDGPWTYFLHGFECRFEHRETGQRLEVVVVAAPEYGLLDPYFLHEYLRTTPACRALLTELGDAEGVGKALRVLAQRGQLAAVEAAGHAYWVASAAGAAGRR